MNVHQSVKVDERTIAVAHTANSWGLNFVLFALLLDVMYRAVAYNEAAWDLLALTVVAGGISSAYMARHKVLGQLFGWRQVVIMVIAAVVSAIVAAVLAMGKMM